MKIVWIDGGLGNQLFQYIFYRYLEVNSQNVCLLDDRYFFHEAKHNGYELFRIFKLTPKLFSTYLDKEVWDEILEETRTSQTIVDVLNENGMDITLLTEGDFYLQLHKGFKHTFTRKYYSVDANSYLPDVARIEGDIYYHGHWINRNWFLNIRDFIVSELKFPAVEDEYNASLLQRMHKGCSVGVHIRRGDFVTLGWLVDSSYYKESLSQMRLIFRKPEFYIFSDDLAWCKENQDTLGFVQSDDIVFVDGNRGSESFRDMQLMTMCKNLVIANSSFSYLAGLLNQTPNKLILMPTRHREMV